jgi:phage terminase small subunit
MSDAPLPLRHLRFVHEYLKDGNATLAYVRAGYSRRSAQPCASRLLARPHIAAAIAVGRQRLAQALEVAVVDQLRSGLEKAAQARRAGIIGLKVRTHRKQEQRVTPRPGRPSPMLTAQERKRPEELCAACESPPNHRKQ